MRIATWNVNSIRMRQDAVAAWLADTGVDVLLLQETKCVADAFPADRFRDAGYRVEVVGQKARNGVAVIARCPIAVETRRLPGDDLDEEARYLEVTAGGLRIACLYLPNGNPVEEGTADLGAKYAYKLRWMARLKARAAALLANELPVVFGGDFNVIPDAEDVYDPVAWQADALFRLETRRAFRAIVHLGLTDAYRACHPGGAGTPPAYTFWDYQAGRWPRDQGLRIDHFLLGPAVADRLAGCLIDRAPRGAPKASDHTPVILVLTDGLC